MTWVTWAGLFYLLNKFPIPFKSAPNNTDPNTAIRAKLYISHFKKGPIIFIKILQTLVSILPIVLKKTWVNL